MKLRHPELLRSQSYIGGRWCEFSAPGFDVLNPADGGLVARVDDAGPEQTRAAIDAAEKALPGWQNRTASERAEILLRWCTLQNRHSADLAQIMTAEQGKPISEAEAEIVYGSSYIQWFAEEAKRVYGDVIPPPCGDQRIVVIKQPIGIVAAITPWNFPNAMLARKVAPALAAGCTVVAKPAELTPLSALAMAKLGEEAGIPPGVFNVVCTSRSVEVGKVLCEDSRVRKLTFTGSTATGKKLLAQCAATVKRTSMELGGNAPFIIFNDADLDLAVDGVMASKFRNAGQTCVCANRLLVQAEVYEEFADRLFARIKALRLGPGEQPGVDMGPLINQSAVEKVQRIVHDAISKGATAKAAGLTAEMGPLFADPTMLLNCTPDMAAFREEIFGPIAPLFRFEEEREAIALANDVPVGLAAYFYTEDRRRVWRVSESLQYGIVGINEAAISNPMAPFGGVKESGSGREGSKYAIDDYLEIKYLCFGSLD